MAIYVFIFFGNEAINNFS